MDLRRVKYFVTVAEELNFRRAANRLYVTQPVVSEQIRKLETGLGVQLLERSPQFVRLTEAGAAFLIDARRLLAHAMEAEEAARRRVTSPPPVCESGSPLTYSPALCLRRCAASANSNRVATSESASTGASGFSTTSAVIASTLRSWRSRPPSEP